MSRGSRATIVAAAAAAFAVAIYGGIRMLNAHPPPLPAIIVRTADAHHLLSDALDARVERVLHDRFPVNRSSDAKLIALTFDDGPYPVQTPLLLDVLHDLDIKATFFLIGDDAQLFPGITARIAAQGHEIGNHTLTHPERFDELSPLQVRDELLEGADMLERYARDPAIRTLMRPPHGRFTERTVLAAQAAGYHVILWNEDPGDWRTVPSASLARDVEVHATAPDIVLLHSGRMGTTEMLPEIVARFRAAGYQFVTVGELMKRVPSGEILHPLRRPV